MTPDLPQNPREELEVRITALLLGELPADEAAALRETIAADPELTMLHDRLKLVLELVREAGPAAESDEVTKPEPLTLSAERRAELLTFFQKPAPKPIERISSWRANRREWLQLAAMVVGLMTLTGVLVRNMDGPFALLSRSRDAVVPTMALYSMESLADQDREPIVGTLEFRENYRTFTVPVAPSDSPALQAGEKTIIGGDFSSANGVTRNRMARLNADGTLEKLTAASESAPVPNFAFSLGVPDGISPAKPPEQKSMLTLDESVAAESGQSSRRVESAKRVAGPEEPRLLAARPQVRDSDRDQVSDKRFGAIALPQLEQVTEADDRPRLAIVDGKASSAPNWAFDDGLRDGQAGGVHVQNGRLLSRAKAAEADGEGIALGVAAGNLEREQVRLFENESWSGVQSGITVLRTNGSLGSVSVNHATALPPLSPPSSPAGGPTVYSVNAVGYVDVTAQPVPALPEINVPTVLPSQRTDYAEFIDLPMTTVTNFTGITGRRSGGTAPAPSLQIPHFVTNASPWALNAGANPSDPGWIGAFKSPQSGPTKDNRFVGRSAYLPADALQLGDVATSATAPTAAPARAEPAQRSSEVRGENLVEAADKSSLPELVQLQSERDSLRRTRDALQSRVSGEMLNARLKSGVEIIDPAKADLPESRTLLERLRGAVTSDVERTARIAVAKDIGDIAGLTASQATTAFDPYFLQTQFETIQSESVLGKVVEKLNLNQAWAERHGSGKTLNTEESVALLKKKLDLRSDPKSGVIDIRAKSDKPEEAARIANTIAEVYRDSRLAAREEIRRQGKVVLQQALAEQEEKLARAEKELEQRKRDAKPDQAEMSAPKPTTTAPVPQPEISASANPFSTFSLNVSDVSFKLAAASLEKGVLPEPASIRSEEFINAFNYHDPEPTGGAPVAFAWERARYPFAHDRDLVRFSVKTAASGRQAGRPLNLVLLLDNSGSMERADRVSIREQCLRVLAAQLQPQDRVSVVAFARTARLWVDGLPGSQANELLQRVGGLAPDGGTNLEDAMNVAYQTAQRHFLPNGVNRVVLFTDGAANLGEVEPESLKKKVEAHRQQGIALDCFGIGWEGYNDDLLEVLSRNGDGRYGFLDRPEEAAPEFANQLAGALNVAASDVKTQVQFNPRRVLTHRQVGYARHQLTKEQFRDNTVDAAEIAAAESGNALYVVQVDPQGSGPIGVVRVRYKVPATGEFVEQEWAIPYQPKVPALDQAGPAMRLAVVASAFGEWLSRNPYAGEISPSALQTYLQGVPETFAPDPRPERLAWMIRQAQAIGGE
jgi:Mg-chelatase subunit ChlD